MSRSDQDRFADIRAAIHRCFDYRNHLDSSELGAMAYDAVLRNLAVIGEAVRALPREVKDAHPETPWASIAGLRNVVIHEYFRVDPEAIRDIVDNDLARLDEALTERPSSEP
ncbi:hypothetical protein BKD30_06400 [Tersicoccus phoenicis]|uniref:DUF86 domain-containing protein n=1 Tax=Tersicoccus phoenicis TaxID=554083 RepID=A0A1R1LCD8_9MICC|nr:HepT-like ribonuclease domain-containing protein [Tersicoccus phoenicis]OMH25175.1 hypothetical protein BKD30_06400 [Tersicoccus phoenicis]